MREARSRVPAVVQRQHSIVGSVRDLGSDTGRLRGARLPAVTSSAGASLQPRFSSSISPAHISRPGRGWVGWRELRGSAPRAGVRPIPLCYSDVQHNKAKRSGENVAAKGRGEGKGERERRSSRRGEAEWHSWTECSACSSRSSASPLAMSCSRLLLGQ